MKDDRKKYSFMLKDRVHKLLKMKSVEQGLPISRYVEAGMILVSDKTKREITNILERN